MSLIERGIHEWADGVTRGQETGVPLGTAEVVGLAQEIVRLTQALRFYADPKSWDYIDPDRGTVTTGYPANRDRGERARAALEGQAAA